MHSLKSGGSGTTAFPPVAAEVDAAATANQCAYVALVIGLPST